VQRASILGIVLLAASVLPSRADDTLATLKAGGLVPLKSTTIRMKSEDLRISAKRIDVTYRFENTSARDVGATVAFPLPLLDGPATYNSPVGLPECELFQRDVKCRDPINFVGFHLEIEGQAKTPAVDVRAFLDGKDITQRLRRAGLPVSVADPGFEEAVKNLPPTVRTAFEKEGIVIGEYPNYMPEWSTRIQYYWRQRFPAHSTITVKHSYAPVVGQQWGVPQGKCADASQDAALRRIHLPEDIKGDRNIEFVLVTARNWAGPIGDFHLTVTTETADDVPLSCTHHLKQTGPTTWEMRARDYVPKQDLNLDIILAHPLQFAQP
jgi:hypothetical protein